MSFIFKIIDSTVIQLFQRTVVQRQKLQNGISTNRVTLKCVFAKQYFIHKYLKSDLKINTYYFFVEQHIRVSQMRDNFCFKVHNSKPATQRIANNNKILCGKHSCCSKTKLNVLIKFRGKEIRPFDTRLINRFSS